MLMRSAPEDKENEKDRHTAIEFEADGEKLVLDVPDEFFPEDM